MGFLAYLAGEVDGKFPLIANGDRTINPRARYRSPRSFPCNRVTDNFHPQAFIKIPGPASLPSAPHRE